MNINHTNLADSPELIKKTKKLIERSFNYPQSNSFEIDFYPLFNKDNFKNCHILEKDGEVLAHIGLKTRTIANAKITMYGGIAVSEKSRGQGLFKKLFNDLLISQQNNLFHILWSNQLDLYNRFNFHPAISLNEYTQEKQEHSFDIQEIKWCEFKHEDLYHNSAEIRLQRELSDWNQIKEIKSAQIYLIKENDKVVNYFIKGKGADLTETIHEYGLMDEQYLSCMRNFAKVWTPYHSEGAQAIYSAVLKLGNEKELKSFTKKYYDITIKEILDDKINFIFEENLLSLSHSEFLTGILGPTPFKEFQTHKPLFISGLDSI